MLPIPPHFFGLAQRNGVEPQRKTLMGWWRPREVSGPTRLSHSRGRCHSAAKVSASRTDWITRRHGEGFGLEVDWRLKVFCPAFLQKSGRGPGAEPLDARRSARNSPCANEAQEGVKGGTLAGGSPFAGGSRRPQPLRHRGVGGGRRKGSSRTPTPTAGGKRAVRRRIYCEIITRPGRGWRNVVRPAVTAAAGRRGRRPLQGGCGDVGLAVLPRRAGGWNHGQQKRRRPFRAFSSELPSGYHTTVMFRLGRTPFRVAVASMLFSSTG